jgi:UDP-N-acetylmuramate--alanine ligase
MNSNKKDDIVTLIEPCPPIYGVIGVCGVVGNLIARVLFEHDLKVIGTDYKSAAQCKFKYTFENYDLPLYLAGHPENFFKESDYIIPPPSLSKNSNLYKKLIHGRSEVLEVDDILNMIKPDKPVLCITGTNGKTTTTTLLKHICNYYGITTTEHGFKELQGNIDYIPPLQCRLQGDVAILETGTFGVPGDLKFILERCEPSCGIITNITPDHMPNHQDFLSYAAIKSEFVDYLKNKLLIINADDPTITGLINNLPSDITGHIIRFGVDYNETVENKKLCCCGREIIVEETISGMGYYRCECGVERVEPDYLATAIDKDGFILHTPEDVFNVHTSIVGLHNIYNILGAITAAIEFLDIPINEILTVVECFKGVPGRLDYIGYCKGKEVIIDYAHNPGGVETVLRELRKIHGRIAVVITVSSESGETGDINILNKCLENADFIIPASFYSRKAADKLMESMTSEKILLTTKNPREFKKRTLGANLEQVISGLEKALECDVPAVVCIGEAAFKYKEDIYKKSRYLF